MNLLYALIAFSIIMIVASTLVVALVRLLHEFRRMRQRHMRYMLGAVFDEYLWPEFGRIAATLPQQLTRRKSVQYTALNELKPTRGWWYSLFAALDLWTILWAAINGDSAKRRTHDWGSGNFALVSAALWLLILAFITFCIYKQVFFPLFILGIAIFFAVDRAREIDRDRYAIWADIEPARAAKLEALDQLKASAGGAGLSLSSVAEHELFKDEPPEALQALLNDHERLTRRRAFVDEIVKVSKSMAANTGRAENSEIDQVSVVDFAAHLGRTEFGEAIRRAALAQKDMAEQSLADMTNAIIDEVARRYDALGQQSSAGFRDMTRKWSIGLAFVVAFTANVDAPHLFQTLYENPELSQKLEAEYGARVEAMSRLEADLVAEITQAEADQKAAAGTPTEEESQQAAADLKAQLAEVRTQFADTTGELATLGVPVGWDFFPFCQTVDGTAFVTSADYAAIRDARCVSLARALTGAAPDTAVTVRLAGLFDMRQRSRLDAAEPSDPDSFGARLSDYVLAGFDWVAIRLPHGFTVWILGALLGGALIGLGGPFWFDIYKRLSSIAQIARAAGLTGRRTTQTAGDGTQAAPPPEIAHQPKDVRDAFNTAQKVQMQLNRANQQNVAFQVYAALTEEADESRESTVSPPRQPPPDPTSGPA